MGMESNLSKHLTDEDREELERMLRVGPSALAELVEFIDWLHDEYCPRGW